MTDEQRREGGLTRKQLLGAGAGAAAAAVLSPSLGLADKAMAAAKPGAAGGKGLGGKNVILFLTDQERLIQHFPPNWARENLPGLRRLTRNGLSLRIGLHRCLHVLALALVPDDRVLPRPARGEIHARVEHAERTNTRR